MVTSRPDEQAQPFLGTDDDEGIQLHHLSGERTPDHHYIRQASSKPSALLVGLALFITVVGFTINTEATAYFEDVLGWKKPFATLYITHSSLALPWICHTIYLRFQSRHIPFHIWRRDYMTQLQDSITTISAYRANDLRFLTNRIPSTSKSSIASPLAFLATAAFLITLVLTMSGTSWFLSLSLTTPADLTAIYNTSTFFAAAFSVPILKERLGPYSIFAVALSIAGTFIIAYGDTTATHSTEESKGSQVGTQRLLGNLVACAGAVAFGLYEVLFKKWACSSDPLPPSATLPLTLTASALTGAFTFCCVWPLLLALHILGIETFLLPDLYTALWILISVIAGSVSITLLVVLVIWTDPIFGSFANVLSVAFVAVADWLVFGLEPSGWAYVGGGMVVGAFGLLTWDTFREGKKGR